MEFKVGDKVRIKKNASELIKKGELPRSFGFTSEMEDWAEEGIILEIGRIKHRLGGVIAIEMKENFGHKYSYNSKWLEKVNTELDKILAESTQL